MNGRDGMALATRHGLSSGAVGRLREKWRKLIDMINEVCEGFDEGVRQKFKNNFS